uniref:Switch-associated protein 70 n=1 Tax=Nothobranchius furzeri TaxID=105023 RepID=A0A8C6KYI7_NOTFU
MWLRDELLKSIWYAFTALDVDHRGKVSKSQLKVSEDFDVIEFYRMCWTLCYKKNIYPQRLIISDNDAFRVWCIFNFLSEDKYPLVIVIEEVEYLLRKLSEAMGIGWNEERFVDYKLQQNTKSSLSVWELIELVGLIYFSKGTERQILSMGINEVFSELILDILKQGYMMKKGHKRKNWTERWFVLQPTLLSYYTCEDLTEKKGDIILDQNCFVEPLQDKDGKKCLFIIKCSDKSFEINASDKKKKQEWIQAVQTCIQQQRLGLLSPHREARLRRRELRQRQRVEEDDLSKRMRRLQASNESKQKQLEDMRMKMEEAAAKATLEELRRKKNQSDLQDRYRMDLEREKMVRQQMEEQVAQKSSELEQYLQRVRELEELYHRLEEALEDERQAKQDEEAARKLQTRLLEQEAAKRAELEQIYLQQQRTLSQTEAEKEELRAEQLAKERELQAATQLLERLESERHGALEQYQEVSRKLERAANKTKTWKDKVAKQEGLVRLIQPGHKGPQRITNWGPASFSDMELDLRKKSWQESKNQGAQAQ